MSSYHIYLNLKHMQDVNDERLQHIVKMVDKEIHEVRVYTKGLDFQGNPHDRPLPYGIIDVNQKHMETSSKRL